jgi:hypothetical protein
MISHTICRVVEEHTRCVQLLSVEHGKGREKHTNTKEKGGTTEEEN